MRRELLSGGLRFPRSLSFLALLSAGVSCCGRGQRGRKSGALEPRTIIIRLIIRSLTSPREPPDLTFRVFFIVSRMSPQRTRDIQLKSKHLDNEGGKIPGLVKGLWEEEKNRTTIIGRTSCKFSRSANERDVFDFFLYSFFFKKRVFFRGQ